MTWLYECLAHSWPWYTKSLEQRCASWLIKKKKKEIYQGERIFLFLSSPLKMSPCGEIENEGHRWDKWNGDKTDCFIQEFWMYEVTLLLESWRNSRGSRSDIKKRDGGTSVHETRARPVPSGLVGSFTSRGKHSQLWSPRYHHHLVATRLSFRLTFTPESRHKSSIGPCCSTILSSTWARICLTPRLHYLPPRRSPSALFGKLPLSPSALTLTLIPWGHLSAHLFLWFNYLILPLLPISI